MIETIKKNLFSLVLAIAVIVLFVLHFWQPGSGKIGYVDSNVLMQKYEGMKDARLEFQKKAKEWQAQSDTLMKDWKNQLNTYEKERTGMSAKEKQLKEEILRNKQQQINGYRQSMEKKAHDEEQKLTQNVIVTVNDYINRYGKEHGYKFILGANGSGSILYAIKNTDITDVILEGLNKEYKK
jgi:outer membrane protein